MRRERLRDTYTADELAQVYATPHQHFGQPDHRVRVAVTIQLGRALGRLDQVADLACGDGAILGGLDARARTWGDIAPGWDVTGPIEQTIEDLHDVDLFVCAETIEHLDDPDMVLKAIRPRAAKLLLSTPVDAWSDRELNPQHYWAWDREAVEDMLATAGFEVFTYCELDLTYRGPEHYRFGIWSCS
jgi:hypothetical protein